MQIISEGPVKIGPQTKMLLLKNNYWVPYAHYACVKTLTTEYSSSFIHSLIVFLVVHNMKRIYRWQFAYWLLF